MSSLRLITVDITNTVLKLCGTPGKQYAALARKCGIHSPDPKDLDRVYRPTFNHCREHCPNYGVNQGISTRQWWTEFMKRVFVEAGYQGDLDLFENLTGKVWHHFADPSAWEILPSSEESLLMLKQKGLQLGVISNFDERLRGILEGHDLAKLFDFIVTSVEAGYEKPDLRIFQHALTLAGTLPHQAAHIGDDVHRDYLAARTAGMGSYLLCHKDKLAKEDLARVDRNHVIHKLSDLQELL